MIFLHHKRVLSMYLNLCFVVVAETGKAAKREGIIFDAHTEQVKQISASEIYRPADDFSR